MISVIQRVKTASVRVRGEVVGQIDAGLLALVAVVQGDTRRDVEYTADKLVNLRIFADDEGRMNRSLLEAGGALLLVSQFTLVGDARKGRRPSFGRAAAPDDARAMFEEVVELTSAAGIEVERGEFAAAMEVELVNDGPVTLIVDSRAARRGN